MTDTGKEILEGLEDGFAYLQGDKSRGAASHYHEGERYYHEDTVKALQDKVAIAVTVLESRDRLRADIVRLREALVSVIVTATGLEKETPYGCCECRSIIDGAKKALEKTNDK